MTATVVVLALGMLFIVGELARTQRTLEEMLRELRKLNTNSKSSGG